MATVPVIPPLQINMPRPVAKLDPVGVVAAGAAFQQTQVRGDEVTVPDIRPAEFNIKEQFGVGALGTFIGQGMMRYASPDPVEQPNWRTKETDQWLLAAGLLSDPFEASIINAAANQNDLNFRVGLVEDSRSKYGCHS